MDREKLFEISSVVDAAKEQLKIKNKEPDRAKETDNERKPLKEEITAGFIHQSFIFTSQPFFMKFFCENWHIK